MPRQPQSGWQEEPGAYRQRSPQGPPGNAGGNVYGGRRIGDESGRAGAGGSSGGARSGSQGRGSPRTSTGGGRAQGGSGRGGRTPAPNRTPGAGRTPGRGGGSGRASGGAATARSRGRDPRSGASAGGTRPPGGRDPQGRGKGGGRPPKGPRPRRRTPFWAKLTLAAGAVLMLLSGSALAGYEVLNNRYAGNVQQDELLGGAAVEPGEELEGPLNLLMLGVEEQGEGARSDSIIILHIPSSHDEAYLMSVPRDTYVTVPGYWDMKITEAFAEGYAAEGGWSGGARLVASVINNLTGLRFNGAAIVNFDGFRKIIDEMGGIEYCVDTEAYSEHLVLVDGEPVSIFRAQREGLYYEEIRYEVGCRVMEGWEALDYARQRKTLASEEGDYGRQRHQVQLLQAMAAKATSSDVTTNLSTLDSLILAAGDALIVDTNSVPLADFAFTLRNLRPGNLVTLQTNQGEFQSQQINGQSVESLTPESVQMFQAAADDTMAQFILAHPEFRAPDQSTEQPAAP